MPKAVNPSQSSNRSLFVYKYKNKRVLATRETRHDAAVRACRTLFSDIPASAAISFQTKDLDICEGEMTEISESSWEDVVRDLKSVTVMIEENPLPPLSSMNRPLSPPEDPSDARLIRIKLIYNGQFFQVKVPMTYRLANLLPVFASRTGMCEDGWRLFYDGSMISYNHTPADLDMEDNAEIDCFRVLIGGKPVIYLFSPNPLEASIQLSLVPQWSFSAVYPVVPVKPKAGRSNEEISWRVQVRPTGELTELTTGLEVAYLFWEAHTNASKPPTPPPSPVADSSSPGAAASDVEAFIPTEATLRDDDSVVISVDKTTLYLDKTLSALGLHTEARTSFITYWLPAMLKHKNIAFRFLTQASYERAAPLEVHPPPDVTTRVFMLFQGVEDEELVHWPRAIAKAGDDVSWWRDIVGVNADRAADASLFRVLEWGGMEVLRSRS